jgi:hypothetical protein
LYFDLAGATFAPAPVTPLVTVSDPVIDEGQECFRIATSRATYFFQKLGAGFSSLVDEDGRDWIGYHPQGGSAGHFRGIPNSGVFHPGYLTSTSRLRSHGPLKATLYAETLDGGTACTWEIYPDHATFTMLRADRPYWFLYEGTPGGKFDQDRDRVVRSPGVTASASESWAEALPDPAWVYFADGESGRALYAVQHEPDDLIDSYWPMNRQMTVFGFGRRARHERPLAGLMTRTPNRFTIGLHAGGAADTVAGAIDSAFQPCALEVGVLEERQPEAPGKVE